MGRRLLAAWVGITPKGHAVMIKLKYKTCGEWDLGNVSTDSPPVLITNKDRSAGVEVLPSQLMIWRATLTGGTLEISSGRDADYTVPTVPLPYSFEC